MNRTGSTQKPDMFGQNAADYDAWYQTPTGAFIDQVETELVFRLLPPPSGRRVLDAGSGTGNFSAKLSRETCDVIGVDQSQNMLSIAKQKGINATFIQADLRRLPFPDDTFAAIYSICTIEFIRDLHIAFAELWRVLAPGGELLIGSISADSPWGEHYRRRAQRKPDSIFRYAHFRTRTELFGFQPENVVRSGECLFIPPMAPPIAFNSKQERQFRQLYRGGFFAVLWAKPKQEGAS